jgi:MATE family, multidrug efflux pump
MIMDEIAKTRPVSSSRKVTGRTAIHRFAVELSEIAKLAWPMVLSQVGQIAMMTTDLAFIGRISAEALAAAGLAGRFYLISVSFGVGLLSAIAPLAAQAFGANNLAAVRRTVRMGLWTALVLSFPIIAVALRAEKILLALGQAPDVAPLAQQYLSGLGFSAAPALAFLAIRSFMGAVHRPQPVLWITLSAIPLNTLLVYMLAYGKLGLPRLELFGAGLATTLVNCGMFLASLWFAAFRQPFRDYHVLAQLWRFDWRAMRQLIAIGTPISASSLIESGLFWATSLLAGLISTSALVAHQIAVQIAAILFMIYLGVGTAAAVRVGHAAGRGDSAGVKRANLGAMLIGIALAAMLTLALIAARFEIVQLFLGRSAPDSEVTIGLAAKLLILGATLFIADAAQCIAAGSLRGLKDTRVLLLLGAIAWWLIGFPVSYWLSLEVGLGAIGIWIGLSIGTTIYAALLVLRFRHLTSRVH